MLLGALAALTQGCNLKDGDLPQAPINDSCPSFSDPAWQIQVAAPSVYNDGFTNEKIALCNVETPKLGDVLYVEPDGCDGQELLRTSCDTYQLHWFSAVCPMGYSLSVMRKGLVWEGRYMAPSGCYYDVLVNLLP